MLGFSIGRVQGNSMVPRISPDSFIVAVKLLRFIPKRVGQVYYLQHPHYGRIVKTLASIDGDALWFRGESEESVSMSAMGALNHEQIIGRVIWVISAR